MSYVFITPSSFQSGIPGSHDPLLSLHEIGVNYTR